MTKPDDAKIDAMLDDLFNAPEISQAEIRKAYAQMNASKRLVESGEAFRAQYPKKRPRAT